MQHSFLMKTALKQWFIFIFLCKNTFSSNPIETGCGGSMTDEFFNPNSSLKNSTRSIENLYQSNYSPNSDSWYCTKIRKICYIFKHECNRHILPQSAAALSYCCHCPLEIFPIMTRICVVYRDYNIDLNHDINNFVLSVNMSSIIDYI